MVKVEEFYFESRDKITKIHAVKWIPDTEIKCVLQIVHGLAEYIMRYDEFARFMAAQGVLVVGCDNLGHGKTAGTTDDQGYICAEDGETVIVRDVHRLKKLIQEENIGKPYFILGHSMGSFIVRNYIWRYGKGIQGALIISTSGARSMEARFSLGLIRVMTMIFGDRHKSPYLTKQMYRGYTSRLKPSEGINGWICSDSKVVDAYNADNDCGFDLTLNGFRVLVKLTILANKKENLAKIPKHLPVYIAAGTEDPVGQYGKGVKEVFEGYKAIGMDQIELKMYEGFRHEILNETKRFEVYEDIYHWLLERLKQK